MLINIKYKTAITLEAVARFIGIDITALVRPEYCSVCITEEEQVKLRKFLNHSCDIQCKKCQKYPWVLRKACADHFDYAAKLRNGQVVRFVSATVEDDYVTLYISEGVEFPCPRGLNVRLNDIVWLADAPCGS